MSRRARPPAGADVSLPRAMILLASLSVVAILIATAALAVVLARGADNGSTGEVDPNTCRTAAWDALPSGAALPLGWTIASTRFFVDNLSLTLAVPTASSSAQDPSVFVSVSCFGDDSSLALVRSYDAAIGAGGTSVSFPTYGDETRAVASIRTGSTTISIRRGILVADITAASSLDATAMQAVAGAVDAAMTEALSESPRPSAPGASPGTGKSPEASASSVPSSAVPSPSAVVVSHVAPDLEALLPSVVDETTLVSQSISGTTALQGDATSKALLASLEKLGRTAADLEIAEAHDPAGKLLLRLYAFRAEGVQPKDLVSAIVAGWTAGASPAPTRSDVTIGGKEITKVSFAQGVSDYLYRTGDVVIDIEATDEALVAKVLGLIR